MKRTLLASAILLLSVSAFADVEKHDTAWGKSCNSKDSFAVKLINLEQKSVDFKVCLEKVGGTWSCYGATDVAPGEVYPDSWGFSVCHGTGDVKWWYRDTGDYTKTFPSP